MRKGILTVVEDGLGASYRINIEVFTFKKVHPEIKNVILSYVIRLRRVRPLKRQAVNAAIEVRIVRCG